MPEAAWAAWAAWTFRSELPSRGAVCPPPAPRSTDSSTPQIPSGSGQCIQRRAFDRTELGRRTCHPRGVPTPIPGWARSLFALARPRASFSRRALGGPAMKSGGEGAREIGPRGEGSGRPRHPTLFVHGITGFRGADRRTPGGRRSTVREERPTGRRTEPRDGSTPYPDPRCHPRWSTRWARSR